MIPRTAVLSILVLISLLLVSLQSGLGNIGGEFDSRGQTIIELDFFPSFEIDGYGGMKDGKMELRAQTEFHIGLSDGSVYRQVLDPDPGAPMIPWFATTISSRYDIEDVDLIVEGNSRTRVPEGLMCIPPPVDHWSDPHPYTPWMGESYPSEQVRIAHLGYRHVEDEIFRVYSLWFTPFELDSNEINCATTGTIKIETSESMTEPSETRADGDPSLVPGTLSIHEKMDVPPEYLIITHEDNIEPLRTLSEWRNRKGLATSVIDIDHILGNYSGSGDEADLLREYIKDVRTGWGRLKYVMLAGDWTTIPVKRVKDSDPSSWDDGWIPADSYFQCLDGTWDLDGDGIHGEVGDMEDIIPDITVSRLAIDDPGVWSDKVEQIIEYEKQPSSRTWTDRSVLIGANTHNEGDGTQFSEYLRDKYLSSAYGEVTTLYEDQGTLSRNSIHENLQGGSSFVQFVDHGGPLEWCDDYGAGVVYRDRDARSLSNGRELPFVSTLACLTTWFDDTSGCPYNNWENSLGEAFTENTEGGAIGYVGSSRVSVGIINTNRYLPYDNGLVEDVARQIGGMDQYVLGDVHTKAKTHYAEVWGGSFVKENNPEVSLCWLEFTLLGEPATDLWTDTGGTLSCSVEHEDDLDPHIVVMVTDDSGAPVENANVSLQNFERSIFQRLTTDGEGKAVFDLVLDWFCDINLTVTKRDMVPFSGFIRISDVIPPVTEITTIPAEPDGENGWFLREPVVRLEPNEKGIVHYRIGMGPQSVLNSSMNFTLPSLEEGVNEIHFFSEDEAGNLELERHETIKIDRSDPDFTVLTSPSEPDGSNDWFITEPMVSVNDFGEGPGSGETVYYRIDDDILVYSSPFYVPEGEHRLEIWAEDLSGRSSNKTVLYLKVDITSPQTDLEVIPREPDGIEGWYVTRPIVSIITSEPGCKMEYRTSPADDFIETEGEINLPEGDYWFEYRSIDLSGNMGVTHRERFKVDLDRPVIFSRIIPVHPDGKKGWYVTNPELSLRWDDENLATILLSTNGGPWEEWKGNIEIPDGEHGIEAKAVDTAGLESDILLINLNVDTRPPETNFTVVGAKEGHWFRSPPTIFLEAGPGENIYFSFSRNEDHQPYTGPLSPSIKEGEINLYYYGTDQAGNIEDENSRILRIDTVDPLPRLSWTMTDDGTVTLDSSSTTDGTRLRYRFIVDGEVLRDWSSDPVFSLKLDPGAHIITVEVKDSAGNKESLTSKIEVKGFPYALVIAGVSAAIILLAVAITIWIGRRKHGVKHPHYKDHAIFYSQYNPAPQYHEDGKIIVEAIEDE